MICFGQSNASLISFFTKDGFESASIGFCLKDMNGKTINSINPKVSLIPASILKLVTTSTALETLGEDYKFKTTLAINKNNPQQLIIHGYGDPTLGSEHLYSDPNLFLTEWIKQIKEQFTTEKPLEILVVDNYFGYNGVSSKWLHEDLGNYFAAGSYGISIYDNLYRLYLNSIDINDRPKIIKTVPVMDNISFLNTLSVNTKNKDNGYIYGEIFSNNRVLVGDIPAKRTSFSIKGDIPNPGLMLGNILANKLKDEGFSINKTETSRGDYYKNNNKANTETIDEDIFYTHFSPPLNKIIRVINEKSNNHYTEHLMRIIGRTSGNKDIHTDALTIGIDETISFWNSKGIRTSSMHIYDGCGLAPSNTISPETLCDILVYMNASKNKDPFLRSLPKAGKEGTVRNVLKGTRLEGKVYMKSGSIANVQCFSGYYVDKTSKLAFTIMVNNYNSPRKQVVEAIENLLLKVLP